MRLLYCFGKFGKLNTEIDDYVSINFSREYEFCHNWNKCFKDNRSETLELTISTTDRFLPHDFWGDRGIVYNCTAFVGENGSGKTTILQNIITFLLCCNEELRHGEWLIAFQDNKKIYSIAHYGDRLLYPDKTIDREAVTSGNIFCEKITYHATYGIAEELEDVNKANKELSNAIEATRVAYFANTFSKNDMLEYVSRFYNVEVSQKRYDLCVKNYSLTKRVFDAVDSNDSQNTNVQSGLFWNRKYRDEVQFVFSDKAEAMRNNLKEIRDFKIPLPQSLSITFIRPFYSPLNKDLVYIYNNVLEKYFEYISSINSRKHSKQSIGGPIEESPTFYIALHALLRYAVLLNSTTSADFKNDLDNIINDFKSNQITDNKPVETQEQLLSKVCESLLNRIALSTDSDIVKKNLEIIKSSINRTYDFCKFLYKSEIVLKLDFTWCDESTSNPSFDYSSIRKKEIVASSNKGIFSLKASTANLKDSSDILVEFINMYNATLSYLKEDYLLFDWGLSSGEDNVLDMLASLNKLQCDPANNNIHTIQIFLDEADIGYHPEWQRLWFYIFPRMVEELFNGTNVTDIQFFIATHSPLLLGDLPSKCVNYLERKNDGKLRITERLDDDGVEMETFGQNLYTILRNGFFLKNGTIGEIAIKKSEEIADAFRLLRKLKKDIDIEPNDEQEIKGDLEKIKELNEKAIIALQKDSIEFDRSKNEKTIKSKSNESIQIECGAYLYYLENLISIYSGFIRERLMNEFMDLKRLLYHKDERTREIKAIDVEIKRLEEMKKKWKQCHD